MWKLRKIAKRVGKRYSRLLRLPFGPMPGDAVGPLLAQNPPWPKPTPSLPAVVVCLSTHLLLVSLALFWQLLEECSVNWTLRQIKTRIFGFSLLPFALTACYAITWPPWQLETQEAAGSHKITIQQRANDAKQSHGHGQEPLSQKGLGQQQHVPCIKIVQAMLKTFIPFSPKFGSGGVLPAPAEQWRRNTEKNKYKTLFLLDRKGKLNYKIKVSYCRIFVVSKELAYKV